MESVQELIGVLYDDGDDLRVEQLINGYSNEKTAAACGSVSLITIGEDKILIDCGLPSTNIREYVKPKEISYVIVTHWHPDHCGRLCDFPKAQKVLPDNENDFTDFGWRLKLLKLSGHSEADLAVVFKPSLENNELIVVAGDLFENAADYFSDEPAVKGLNSKKLIESRQQIRNLNPSIVVPGHGKAFRLRPTIRLNDPIVYGNVSVRYLDFGNSTQDPVWFLIDGKHQILINTSETGLPKELLKDNTRLSAIVILKPSVKSTLGLGLFESETIYMDGDVLRSPDLYSTLDEYKWIIDQTVKVAKGNEPASLKVEIYDPKNGKLLKIIEHQKNF